MVVVAVVAAWAAYRVFYYTNVIEPGGDTPTVGHHFAQHFVERLIYWKIATCQAQFCCSVHFLYKYRNYIVHRCDGIGASSFMIRNTN